jgi:hypothetical protein
MTIQQQAVKFGQRRLARRLGRSLPWIGAVVALATLGSAIRRKGLLRGSVDSALNAIPLVGGVKNVAEMVRGRDFIADRM